MKRRLQKLISMLLVCSFIATALCACGTDNNKNDADEGTTASSSSDSDKESDEAEKKTYKIGVVAGESSSPWYIRSAEGAELFMEERGIEVFQKAPTSVDAAEQVQVVEDVIAQGVDALCIIPIAPEALEPVLEKARSNGIVVISHEGSTLNNIDYDVEAFTPEGYGAFMMDLLAEQMNYEGKYVCMVSFLTMSSHNEWIDAAIARQKEKYPDMELVEEERVESQDSQEGAYERAKELLKKYPDLKGILGSSSFDAPGSAKAIEELGLVGQVFTTGTSTTSSAQKYMEDGTMKNFTLWDPAISVYAMCDLAVKILDGEEIGNGVNLGIEGYESMTIDETGKILMGSGWVCVTKDTMQDYDF